MTGTTPIKIEELNRQDAKSRQGRSGFAGAGQRNAVLGLNGDIASFLLFRKSSKRPRPSPVAGWGERASPRRLVDLGGEASAQ